MTSVAADYDHMEIQQQQQQQYSSDTVNNRWDVDEWDNENSSARLFERSRIKALAGMNQNYKTTGSEDRLTHGYTVYIVLSSTVPATTVNT